MGLSEEEFMRRNFQGRGVSWETFVKCGILKLFVALVPARYHHWRFSEVFG